MSEGPGEHTELTPRSFASFGLMMLGLGLLSVGFSVIDTAMVAPFGLVQVAAVGLGESVVSLLLAFFAGFIDVFTARLARAEGAGQSDRVFPELLRAYLIVVGLMELLAVVVAAAVWVVLPLVVSDQALAHAARQYAAVRLLGVALVAALAGVREALKIVGARTGSLAVYAVGLGMNAALNAVFLHVMSGTLAGAATVAVAMATLVAQLFMTIIGGILLRRHLAVREFEPPSAAMVREQAHTMAVRGAGVGVRHLNDYAGSTILFVMAGTLGVTWVAASTVASTIWTLFCRVPQACFGAAFVFYGYVSESGGGGRARGSSTHRHLLRHPHGSGRRGLPRTVAGPDLDLDRREPRYLDRHGHGGRLLHRRRALLLRRAQRGTAVSPRRRGFHVVDVDADHLAWKHRARRLRYFRPALRLLGFCPRGDSDHRARQRVHMAPQPPDQPSNVVAAGVNPRTSESAGRGDEDLQSGVLE